MDHVYLRGKRCTSTYFRLRLNPVMQTIPLLFGSEPNLSIFYELCSKMFVIDFIRGRPATLIIFIRQRYCNVVVMYDNDVAPLRLLIYSA